MNKSTPISELNTGTSVVDDNDETIQELLRGFNQQEYHVEMPAPVHSQAVNSIPAPIHMIPNPIMQQAPLDKFGLFWDRDIGVSFMMAVVALIIMIAPVEKFVYTYINLDHIPYSPLIVKAFLIGAAYYLISKTTRT